MSASKKKGGSEVRSSAVSRKVPGQAVANVNKAEAIALNDPETENFGRKGESKRRKTPTKTKQKASKPKLVVNKPNKDNKSVKKNSIYQVEFLEGCYKVVMSVEASVNQFMSEDESDEDNDEPLSRSQDSQNNNATVVWAEDRNTQMQSEAGGSSDSGCNSSPKNLVDENGEELDYEDDVNMEQDPEVGSPRTPRVKNKKRRLGSEEKAEVIGEAVGQAVAKLQKMIDETGFKKQLH